MNGEYLLSLSRTAVSMETLAALRLGGDGCQDRGAIGPFYFMGGFDEWLRVVW